MCGVAQVAFLNTPNRPERQIADRVTQILMGELLIATLSRGKDATGIALAHEDKSYAYLKGGWESPKMVNIVKDRVNYPDNWEALLKHWSSYPSPVINAIGHVRKETKGSSSNNDNCHPIHRGNIIGVHNGQAENDVEIMNSIEGIVDKRKGECDSEAIFSLMEAMGNELDWTPDMVKELCGQLSGAFTVLAFNRLFPSKFILFRNAERPASVAVDFNLGLLIVGSEGKNIDDAVAGYNRIAGIYFRNELPIVQATTTIFGANKAVIFDVNQPIGDAKYAYEFLKGKEFDVSFLDKKAKTYTNTGFTQNAYTPAVGPSASQVSAITPKPSHSHTGPRVTTVPIDDTLVTVTPCSVTELEGTTDVSDGEYFEDITTAASGVFHPSHVVDAPEDAEALLDDEDADDLIDEASTQAYDSESPEDTVAVIAEEIEEAFEAKGISTPSVTSTMNAEQINELCTTIFEAGYKLGFKRVYVDHADESEKARHDIAQAKSELSELQSKVDKKEAISKRAYALAKERLQQVEQLKKIVTGLVDLFNNNNTKGDAVSPRDTLAYLAGRFDVDLDTLLLAFKKEFDINPSENETQTQTAN